MKVSNMLWGLILIVVGLILGLNALEITNINLFFDGWWTFFIIVPSFIDLFKDEDKTGDIIGIVIGICLLLACNDLIDFSIIWKLLIPFSLVLIGLSIIFKDNINNKIKEKIKKIDRIISGEYCAVFGSQNINFDNEEFNGSKIDAIFGSVSCDLRNAIIKGEVVIDVSSIFGGVTILVPEDVNVNITSMPIFGSVDDKRKNKKGGKNTIYIDAKCLFGGVDIK